MATDDVAGFGLRVEARTRHLHGPAGTAVLTVKQHALLRALLQGRGGVVSREDLLAAAWEVSRAGTSRALDVHIAALRGKLHATCGALGVRIETVRGIGYRLITHP